MTLRQRYKELYWCWKAIKQRCLNPNCSAYHNYGARGISVCNDWQNFEPFLEWALAKGWSKGLELDRIDNDAGYEPANCRFIERRENVNNRRKTIKITVGSITKPCTIWAEELGVSRSLIKSWYLNHGEEYASSRIAEILDSGYTPRDYSRNHRKKVVNIESGEVFNSVVEAANSIGLSASRLSTVINHKGGVTHNGTFCFEQ